MTEVREPEQSGVTKKSLNVTDEVQAPGSVMWQNTDVLPATIVE